MSNASPPSGPVGVDPGAVVASLAGWVGGLLWQPLGGRWVVKGVGGVQRRGVGVRVGGSCGGA